MKNKDYPAMPVNDDTWKDSGLTKREYFAAHAPLMPDHYLVDLVKERYGKKEKITSHHKNEALTSWPFFYADAVLEMSEGQK